MKVKREIASVPVRSAKETWQAIVALISGTGTPDAATLKAAASIMESLIADEHPATEPITVKGSGDRLVIYCRYNEDALSLERTLIRWRGIRPVGLDGRSPRRPNRPTSAG